jgi:hypothetical protein
VHVLVEGVRCMKKIGNRRKIIEKKFIRQVQDHPNVVANPELEGFWEHDSVIYRYVGTLFGVDNFVKVDEKEDDPFGNASYK